ncbi:MAG: FxsA family protein [Parvularcula sp.]|jgi:UPF0716 protein FxsA|nr:FxsA family protein [Parvularcula sp.]
MALILFLVLVALPVAEIFLLMKGAVAFGVLPVLGLTILTAAIGTFIIRRQGLAVLSQLRQDLGQGRPPVAPVVDGAALLVAAPLLMTPGFVTDTAGFLLLVPFVRRGLARAALERLRRATQDGRVVIIRR